MDSKDIMFDDPEAAVYKTDIKGWVSSKGHFFGDSAASERLARYDGCTHRPCEKCGKPCETVYMICKDCRTLAEIDRYNARPKATWDGEAMLYSDRDDQYFADLADAIFAARECDCSLGDLRLIICKPNYPQPITGDYFYDACVEDGELPDEITEAMQTFNKSIAGIILSWSPDRYALDLNAETQTE